MVLWLLAQPALLLAAVGITLVAAPRPLRLAPLTVALVHVTLVQAITLAAGLVGRLDRTGLLIGAFVALAGAIAFVLTRRVDVERQWRCWVKRAGDTMHAAGRGWCVIAMVLLAAMTLAASYVGWIVGPYLGDAVSYHLAPATEWIARGRIERLAWHDVRAYWPQGNGLVMAWTMAWGGSIRAAPLGQLHWLLLLIAAAWALSRQMGGSTRAAVGAAAALSAAPIIWAQAAESLNDLAVASLLLTAVAMATGRTVTWRHAAWCIAALALGLGVKGTMLMSAPVFGVFVVVRWWWHRRTTGKAADRRVGRSRASSAVVGGATAAAIVLGGYWYAGNVIELPDYNPLYPSPLKIAGHELWAGHPRIAPFTGRVGFSQLGENLHSLLRDRVWDVYGFTSAQTPYGTGFGPLAVGLGAPAMIGLLASWRRSRPAISLIVLATLTVAASTNPDVFNGRFFNFAAVGLIVAMAVVTERLAFGAARRVWSVFVAAAWGWAVATSIANLAPPDAVAYWRDHGFGLVPHRVLGEPNYAHLFDAIEAVPPDAEVYLIADATRAAPVALMHGESISRRFVYATVAPDPPPLDEWRARGVAHWLCLAMRGPIDPRTDAMLRAHGYEPVAEGVYHATW